MAVRVALAALMAFTFGLVPLTTATPAAAASTCYGGMWYWGTGHYQESGGRRIPESDDHYDHTTVTYPSTPVFWYRASSRCRDINLQVGDIFNGSEAHVQVCFRPSSAPDYCNGWKRVVDYTPWTVIASDVKDGTIFSVEFRFPYPDSIDGYIAY